MYTFDKVFGKESSQKDIFSSVTESIQNLVYNGADATIFAYG